MIITRLIMCAGAVLLLALDQWAKHWARQVLRPVGRIEFIKGWLDFRYAENTGASFGMLQGGRWFFVAITIVVLAVMVWYERQIPYEKRYLWMRVPMTAIMAGALGNFIDRLLNGFVVDLFEMTFIERFFSYRFPIFNVADVLLIGGTAVFTVALLFILKDQSSELS